MPVRRFTTAAIRVMDETPPEPVATNAPAGAVRLPRARFSAILAAVMLGLGTAAGAAVGPAPASSSAASDAAAQVPRLLALLEARERERAALAAAAAAATPAVTAAAATPAAARVRVRSAAASVPATPASTTTTTAASSEEPRSTATSPSSASKLPAITSVWLIELSGTSFANAVAQPSAAPYIDGQAIGAGELLSGWSAVSADALAGAAALARPVAAGSAPALLHQITQPPCPEGAAGAACAPETPGQLTAADTFLKETLATITSTAAYREGGLVVVTFASVAQPTEAGLPAGSSSATLTSQPPAGVLLLSPFAHAGSKPAGAFDPASPVRSLESLLH
ncbi:MAG TPA: hypothetical protein VHT27_01575 [Solirubrobacteraceae bacterium]|jgi:hypothetical protein|nr:hypothetical protein [Solirubrobacteraceae bacterium]